VSRGKILFILFFVFNIGFFNNIFCKESTETLPKKMIVDVNIASLMREPLDNKVQDRKEFDFSYKTQLFLGERVLALKKEKGWYLVQALEQMMFLVDKGWYPIVGWLKEEQLLAVEQYPEYNLVVKDLWANVYKKKVIKRGRKEIIQNGDKIISVSMGTKFAGQKIANFWYEVVLPSGQFGLVRSMDIKTVDIHNVEDKNVLRENIVKTAKKLLGTPYLWAGKSAYDKNLQNPLTGVDCAGLAKLVFQANGLEIPRYVFSQHKKSCEINYYDLSPGDFIFTAPPEEPKKINHTMLYVGNRKVVEATTLGENVSQNSYYDRVDIFVAWDVIVPYFGSYLRSDEKIAKMRRDFIKIDDEILQQTRFMTDELLEECLQAVE